MGGEPIENVTTSVEIVNLIVNKNLNHQRGQELEALLAIDLYLSQLRKVIDDKTSPVRVFGVPIDKNLRNAVIGYITTTAAAPASIFLLQMLQKIGHGNSHHLQN